MQPSRWNGWVEEIETEKGSSHTEHISTTLVRVGCDRIQTQGTTQSKIESFPLRRQAYFYSKRKRRGRKMCLMNCSIYDIGFVVERVVFVM